jgi:hypothetical protein
MISGLTHPQHNLPFYSVSMLVSFVEIQNHVVIFFSMVYHTTELANGWKGRIISTQVYFSALVNIILWRNNNSSFLIDVLNGGMVTLAINTLNIFHLGCLLHNYYITEKNPDSLTKDVRMLALPSSFSLA